MSEPITGKKQMVGVPDCPKRLSEDASLHFVQGLTTRTRQHVARWQVCPHTMRTFIAGPHGPTLIHFVVDSAPPHGSHSWRLFALTSLSGIELLHAAPPANVHSGTPFASAIDRLFLTVSNTHRRRFFMA